MSNKVTIGIDPGITGAVAVIGSTTEVIDMPVMAKGKGSSKVKNQVNPSELSHWLEQTKNYYGAENTTVYLERVSSMPGMGVQTMFSLGDSYGCIRGVCAALGLRVEIITPQSWKKYYGVGKDKEVARAKAIELFPSVSLSMKKDHNRAEALLIANYGLMKS